MFTVLEANRDTSESREDLSNRWVDVYEFAKVFIDKRRRLSGLTNPNQPARSSRPLGDFMEMSVVSHPSFIQLVIGPDPARPEAAAKWGRVDLQRLVESKNPEAEDQALLCLSVEFTFTALGVNAYALPLGAKDMVKLDIRKSDDKAKTWLVEILKMAAEGRFKYLDTNKS